MNQMTHAAIAEPLPQGENHCLPIPLDGITCTEEGRYQANVEGCVYNLAYFTDVGCWFTLHETPAGSHLAYSVWRTTGGQWHLGSLETLRNRPKVEVTTWEDILLPPLPELPVSSQPVPEVVHYIWLGDNSIPANLQARMQTNAQRCPSYHFQLHAYPHSNKGWLRLKKQFPAKGRITLIDLRKDAAIKHFLTTELGSYFQRFLHMSCLNYAAAADILRIALIHLKGGIYMDVDDQIMLRVTPGHRLLASKSDILLNHIVQEDYCDFDIFSNSCFASQAENPVLAAMMHEMLTRLKQAHRFFMAPRPWHDANSTQDEEKREEMLAYLKNIFFLTGPILFSDVLKKYSEVPFNIERDLLRAHEALNVSPREPRIIADDYLTAFYAAKKHYLPFSDTSFNILICGAHSWNPPDGKRKLSAKKKAEI